MQLFIYKFLIVLHNFSLFLPETPYEIDKKSQHQPRILCAGSIVSIIATINNYHAMSNFS